ncbi:hypothetical protein MASR1M6_32830 [Rubrivivax sp.]
MSAGSSASTLARVLVLVVGALTIAPVAMLAFGSVSEGLDAFGAFTLAKYAAAYTDPALLAVLWNTLVFVLGSTLLATLLALVLAYLNTRTDIPFKFIFGVLAIVPMMIPHLLFSVAWALLLNPSNGLVNRALVDLLGLQGPLLNIYSLPGMIFVEGLLNMPIAYLIIAPAMASFDVSLEESSRVCGSSPGARCCASRCRCCARRSSRPSCSASCGRSPPTRCRACSARRGASTCSRPTSTRWSRPASRPTGAAPRRWA